MLGPEQNRTELNKFPLFVSSKHHYEAEYRKMRIRNTQVFGLENVAVLAWTPRFSKTVFRKCPFSSVFRRFSWKHRAQVISKYMGSQTKTCLLWTKPRVKLKPLYFY